MTARKTAGTRLVAALTAGLAPGVGWTERELITLGLMSDATDRVAVLGRLFDIEVARPALSTRRVTELAAEIRQNEANVQKWATQLDPEMDQQKSQRHVAAANARWAR
jgi:hypothetical protein